MCDIIVVVCKYFFVFSTRAQESGKPPIWLALDEIHVIILAQINTSLIPRPHSLLLHGLGMGLTAHLATALFDHCSSGPHELWCHSEVCLVPGGRESGGHCKELVRSHNLDTLSGISLLSPPLSPSAAISLRW